LVFGINEGLAVPKNLLWRQKQAPLFRALLIGGGPPDP